MEEPTCSVEGCGKAPHSCGMCEMHYTRWRKHGDATVRLPRGWRGKTDAGRFWPKVDKDGPIPERRPDLGPCWIWTGALAKGYGIFSVGANPEHPDRKARTVRAHRFAYEFLVGPIPDGLTIDHLCRNPACVNALGGHLEPVTMAENVLRGESPPAQNGRRARCSEGHFYDVFTGDGGRRCSECDRRKAQRYWQQPSGPLVVCECGCGVSFLQVDGLGRIRRFIHGHNLHPWQAA